MIYGMMIDTFLTYLLSTGCALDQPSSPENLSVSLVNSDFIFNISWTTTMITTRVDQTYVVVFESFIVETTQFYYVFQQNKSDAKFECGYFLAYVKAVNGAGESDPSNNVSIPSLPDIGPVTVLASLTHQVWKYDGEIRVNVTFQVRYNVLLIKQSN